MAHIYSSDPETLHMRLFKDIACNDNPGISTSVSLFVIDQEKHSSVNFGASGGDSVGGRVIKTLEDSGWSMCLTGEYKNQGHSLYFDHGGRIVFKTASLVDPVQSGMAVYAFIKQCGSIFHELGLAALPYGMHPYASLPKSGPLLGERLSIKSAALKASVEMTSPAHTMEALQIALRLAPMMIGLFANSPMIEGRFGENRSARAALWAQLDTEQRHVGLLSPILRRGFECKPAEWVDFQWEIEQGLSKPGPFTRIFYPDALLGPAGTVEIRSADMTLNLGIIQAHAALWSGLLNDSETRAEIRGRVAGWDPDQLIQLRADAARDGLGAKFQGKTLRVVVQDFIELAEIGLSRIQQRVGPRFRANASDMLQPLWDLLSNGTQADQMVDATFSPHRPVPVSAPVSRPSRSDPTQG
jgi:hypothetical protein